MTLVELEALVVELSVSVVRSEATVVRLMETLVSRDARIVELERLLEESRRSGKRQAAPFRKNSRVEEPKTPGRKGGQAHGRHGHRYAPSDPARTLDAPCPASCPDCGGVVDHVRDADQFQTDLPVLPPPATTRFRVGVGRCRSCG